VIKTGSNNLRVEPPNKKTGYSKGAVESEVMKELPLIEIAGTSIQLSP